ncbi:helix-turn-helix domain-containing protein [Persicirhabdus sediminis]|uniref:Helix-turn-helix domain-containing protein n=2 Tax=Persicirhabdus sediminis TaxID=454144 RepID=A0A8J7MJS2_9BACT|nr:helix-turn-helix domain-containing protein [Persicirhabdus sediminis]
MNISIDPVLLERTLADMGLDKLENLLKTKEVIRIPSNLMKGLRSLYTGLARTMLTESTYQDYGMKLDLVGQLLSACAEGAGVQPLSGSHKRTQAVKRARDMIHSCCQQGLSIVELCKSSEVSQRTLEYGFHELYQMTPKAYQKAIMMSAVRKEILAKPDAKERTITAIAKAYGVRHLGKFSADYKSYFGELPSQTLVRAS